MKKKKVGLIDTGTSNIKSVYYALKLFDIEIINIEADSKKEIDLHGCSWNWKFQNCYGKT